MYPSSLLRILLIITCLTILASADPLLVKRQTASQLCQQVLKKRQEDQISPTNDNSIDSNAPQENAQDPSGCSANEYFGRCHLDGVHDAYVCNLVCQCVYAAFGGSAGGCFYDSSSILDVGSSPGCTLYPTDFSTGCTCDASVAIDNMGGI